MTEETPPSDIDNLLTRYFKSLKGRDISLFDFPCGNGRNLTTALSLGISIKSSGIKIRRYTGADTDESLLPDFKSTTGYHTNEISGEISFLPSPRLVTTDLSEISKSNVGIGLNLIGSVGYRRLRDIKDVIDFYDKWFPKWAVSFYLSNAPEGFVSYDSYDISDYLALSLPDLTYALKFKGSVCLIHSK